MAGAIARASSTVPIVIAAASDLVAQGYARNLAQPGGRVTGLQMMSGDLAGKRLEILREMVPRLMRLAVLVPASYSKGFYSERQQTETAVSTLGVQTDFMWVQERNDLAPTFKRVTRSSYDGLLVYANPFMYSERREITQLAKASGVPAIYETREFVIAGGLVSYGPSISVLFRRAATYVDKILKGAKPGDLPIEQPTKFELVINLKTAKSLGLTIPPSVLGRADHIVE
jgi:putative tryptophan/tyrosine transport system substrate-binding protein